MTKLATDIEDLRTELRTRDAEMKTEMKARFEDLLKALTVSHANVDTRLQSVETQALAVNERITAVEKVGEATQRQVPSHNGNGRHRSYLGQGGQNF
jgi:hypothetical protein